MKYSEAIRLGSMLYPQCYCRIVRRVEEDIFVCANGAAALALGFTLEDLEAPTNTPVPVPMRLMKAAPGGTIACPECLEARLAPIFLIAHLNDMHRWTRERIADWLAASGIDFEIDLAKPECALVAEPVAAGVAE